MTWYAAYADHRGVTRAVAGLTERGFTTYVPKEVRWRRHRTGKDRIEHPLLGRYILVDTTEDQLWAIASTQGVAGFIGTSGVPRIIPTLDVTRLQHDEASGLFDRTRTKRFEPALGQAVTITRGIFTGHTAEVVRAMSSDSKVRVFLTALGGMHTNVHVEGLKAA